MDTALQTSQNLSTTSLSTTMIFLVFSAIIAIVLVTMFFKGIK